MEEKKSIHALLADSQASKTDLEASLGVKGQAGNASFPVNPVALQRTLRFVCSAARTAA